MNTEEDGIQKYTLRWFTPTSEVELCGHATLTSAFVLFERMKQDNKINEHSRQTKIAFQSKYKDIFEAIMDWTTKIITLNFPSNAPQKIHKSEYPWIDEIVSNTLGGKLTLDQVQDVYYSSGVKYLLIRLQDNSSLNDERIRKVSPNFEQLLKIDTNGLVKAIMITEKGNFIKDNVHFYSRFFAPWYGVNDDPVTGSAHTVLAPYWKNQFESHRNYHMKDQVLIGKQSSSRGGLIHCVVCVDRVNLSGKAKIIIKGELRI